MTTTDPANNFKLLDSIGSACQEIREILAKNLETTSNAQYKSDIEKDMVNLENLKLITIAVKEDIIAEKIGASTELLLRIAANDFKNKLETIPEKKTLRKEIVNALREVHGTILHQTIKEA